MKIIKNIDFKWIEINFEYKEQKITIKFEPYRTIDYMKEKVINRIMDVSPDINFYYLGKNLSEYNQEKIGNFFKNKEKVTIKLKSLENSYYLNSPSPKNIYNNKSLKYLDYNNILSNDNFQKYKERKNKQKLDKNIINKSQSLKLIKLFEEKNKKLKIDEYTKYNFSKNNSEIKLPVIKNISLNGNNSIRNKIISNNKKKEFYRNNNEIACNCRRHNISEYCRNCKKFICIECKTEQKHRNHLSIKLNLNNLEENIKSYGRQIQDDIEKKIDMNRNAFNIKEMKDEFTMINRKDQLINKYQKAIKFYQKLINKVDKKLKAEDKERASLVVDAYNDLSQKMNKQLLEVLDKLNNNYINCGKEIMFSDLRSFFDEINSKEETLSFLGKDIIKYHLKNEINTKLNSSLDKIDRILDELIDDDIPFNLDNKYYEELIKMEIIKEPKDKKDKDSMTNRDISTTRTKNEDSKSLRNEDKDNFNGKNNKVNLSKFSTNNNIKEE